MVVRVRVSLSVHKVNLFTIMKKLENLYGKKQKSVKDMNIFEKEMFKKEVQTTSGNGSVKYKTTGDIFLDDFAQLANYRELREMDDIFYTTQKLCNIDPVIALRLTVYLRLITRAPFFQDKTLGVHRGQGLKHEYIGRLYFFALNYPKMFKRNLDIFVAAGSWNDLFELLRTDLYYRGAHRFTRRLFTTVIQYIVDNFQNENQVDLIKKYLPKINPSSKCTTPRKQANSIIGKLIAVWDKRGDIDKKKAYADYRSFKASGKAHTWEQKISQQKYNEINFSLIAGRALNKLVKSKFLENHDLVNAYYQWLEKQPVAKFTGYPYELFKGLYTDLKFSVYYQAPTRLKSYQISTLNKQFKSLIETAKKDMNTETSFIVCVDTSGSMKAPAIGTDVRSIEVAISMALYFSELLKGDFANTFLEFAEETVIRTWNGDTPFEKWRNTPLSGECDNTNFLSIANLFVDLKRKGYNESEFPTGVICVSDGEFDEAPSDKSDFEEFLEILRRGGFSDKFVDNFKLVLWDIPNVYYDGKNVRPKFEGIADRPNFYYMSGFDPAGIAFLTGTKYSPSIPKTAEDLFKAALNQELIKKIR